MTQEENAKTYTELINRLEDVKNAIKKQNYGIAMNILCKPYPKYQITTSTELKESEGLRIIKAIKYGLDHVFTNNTTVFEVTKEQCNAWLEKQCEHANFRNKIQIGDKVTRNEDGVLVNLSQLNRVAKKQDEQKPVVIIPKFRVGDEIKTSNEESLTITKIDEKGYWSEDLFICCFDEECVWDLVEQNPAWSEEDEMQLDAAIHLVSNTGHIETANWLKSLRPQNNITDEELAQAKKDAYNDALDKIEYHSGEPTFDDGWSAAIDYIRKKYLTPQNTWKPSDEQIKALNYVVNLMASSERPTENDLYYNILKSLRQQLKKLMEE